MTDYSQQLLVPNAVTPIVSSDFSMDTSPAGCADDIAVIAKVNEVNIAIGRLNDDLTYLGWLSV